MKLREALNYSIFESSPSPLPQKSRLRQRSAPESECAGFLDRPRLAEHAWIEEKGCSGLPGFANSRTEPLSEYAVRSKNAGNRVGDYIRAIERLDLDPEQGL
jgi:hypothetical protein